MATGSIWQTAVDSSGSSDSLHRDGLQLDAQRGEVGAARAAHRRAELLLDHLARPPLGPQAADRDGQAERVGQLGELDADQRPRVGQQGVQRLPFHPPDRDRISRQGPAQMDEAPPAPGAILARKLRYGRGAPSYPLKAGAH